MLPSSRSITTAHPPFTKKYHQKTDMQEFQSFLSDYAKNIERERYLSFFWKTVRSFHLEGDLKEVVWFGSYLWSQFWSSLPLKWCLEDLHLSSHHQPIDAVQDIQIYKFNMTILYVNTAQFRETQQTSIWLSRSDPSFTSRQKQSRCKARKK